VLFCISGGRDLKMVEISEIAKIITENIDPGAKIIFGAYNDRKLKAGQLKVILIATGFNGLSIKRDDSLSLFSGGDHPKQIVGMNEGRIDVKTDVSTTEKPKKVIPENTKKDDDVWDIPTFLRKRKK